MCVCVCVCVEHDKAGDDSLGEVLVPIKPDGNVVEEWYPVHDGKGEVLVRAVSIPLDDLCDLAKLRG